MAALGSQSIASSYEQILQVDRDGGGNSTTHVSVKDGDNGTTFGFTIATDALMMSSTNRLEFGDTGTYIHQSADGVLDLVSDTEIEINATTIDMNGAADLSGNLTVGGDIDLEGSIDVNGTSNLDAVDIDGAVQIDSTVTVGADNTGYDVIFYGDTASSNMTWDTSADDLILNDSTLKIDQDDDALSVDIDSESTSANIINVAADALTTGNAFRIYSNSDSNSSRNLALIINDDASATSATGLMVQQNAAALGVKLDHNADSTTLLIDSESTSANVLNIDAPTTTTGKVINIGDANGLTSGALISLHSASTSTTSRNLFYVANDEAAASAATTIYVKQDSTAAKGYYQVGGTFEVSNDNLDTAASHTSIKSDIVKNAGASNTSDDYIGMYNGIKFSDADASFRELKGIKSLTWLNSADSSESTSATGIDNEVQIEDGDVNSAYCLYNVMDVNAGNIDSSVYCIFNDMDIESGIGGDAHDVYGVKINMDNDTDRTSYVHYIEGATNVDWHLLNYSGTVGSTTSRLSDAGQFDAEGSINASQSLDYAEYFESKDGKAIAVGTTVKLDGDKIVACEDGETPIGVIRPLGASGVVGGGQHFHWQSKYEKDDYDGTVMEDFTWTRWTEEVSQADYEKRKASAEQEKYKKSNGKEATHYEEGDELPEGKKVGDEKTAEIPTKYYRKHKYHTDRIPSGLTAPDDATVIQSKIKRPKLNASYDASKEESYKSREERDEWCIVGLLGQIPITKGQPMADNWVKMKDVSSSVEMYFVK